MQYLGLLTGDGCLMTARRCASDRCCGLLMASVGFPVEPDAEHISPCQVTCHRAHHAPSPLQLSLRNTSSPTSHRRSWQYGTNCVSPCTRHPNRFREAVFWDRVAGVDQNEMQSAFQRPTAEEVLVGGRMVQMRITDLAVQAEVEVPIFF